MTGSASREREVKFAGVDHDELRRRLQELEAEREGASGLEDNWLFDRDGSLERSGAVLRLRIDRRGTRLTYKGPATFDGRTKVRSEHQTGVTDAEATRRLLTALGYKVAGRYQKRREEWMLGSILIALDHTPLGDFAEVEGEGCERVARRLGLDPDTAERRNYLRLWEDHRRDHPEAPPEMLFQ